MPWRSVSSPPHRGQGSCAVIDRRSATCGDLHVPARVDLRQVIVVPVGPGDHGVHPGHRLVGVDGELQAHGAGKAHFGPGQLLDPDEPRQDQVGDPQQVFHLHFIDFVVAADQHRHRPVVGLIDQGLDDVGGHYLEKGRHFLDGAHVGGGHRLRSVAHRRTGLARRQGHLGLLQVGGIVATGAGGQQVLAGVRQDHEFVGKAAADGAGIRLHHLEGQAAAAEDAVIGVVHPAGSRPRRRLHRRRSCRRPS